MAQHGVEQHGVGTIPEAERTSRPRDLVGVLLGGNLALSVAVFGWLPVLYGLGWWASVAAVLAGTAVGSVAVAPLALLGLRSGTNNSVTSGAFFGVQGRLVASTIGLLLCLGFVALTVWTGAEAVVGAVGRATGTHPGDAGLAAGFVVLAAAVSLVAVYGFRWLVALNKVIVVVVGAVMAAVVVALAGSFDAGYAGTPDALALGGFWPTWLLAALTAGVAGPVSYVTNTGDWTRYVSPERHSPGAVVRATAAGLFGGLVLPTLFGTFVSVVAFDENSFVAGLVGGVPGWLVVPVAVAALVGSLGQGGLNLYSMGLDLDAILPRLTRVQSTLVVAAGSTVLVFLGTFVWDAQAAVTTFSVVLTSLATPWAVITLLGYRRVAGRFDADGLQVFNRRLRGGPYWFTGGWNVPTVLAWAVGSAVGVASNATESFTGPVAALLGGVDASFVTSGLAAGACWLALVRLRPAAHVPAADAAPGDVAPDLAPAVPAPVG